jgi:oligopeptide/dipeptide ABC transporter ATP-binding protein
MYSGRVVERAGVEHIFHASHHPYTRGLLASLPSLDHQTERLFSIGGAPPALSRRPAGCAFHPRCEYAHPPCFTTEPPMRSVAGAEAACHLAERLDAVAPGLAA